MYIIDTVYIMYYDVFVGGDHFDSSYERNRCP